MQTKFALEIALTIPVAISRQVYSTPSWRRTLRDAHVKDRGIMRLTRTNVYALQASLQLAEAPRGLPIPCSRLAREGKMPERFLLQVLRVLVRHQVLKSTCGVAGGYYLARAPERISLRDLLQPFDEAPQRAARMLHGVSNDVRLRLTSQLCAAKEASWQQLQNISLAEIARGSAPSATPLPANHTTGTPQTVNILLPSLAFTEVSAIR